jgi:hypothetical protein
LVAQRIDELKDDIAKGGPREAVLRALLYIRMPEGLVDERGFNFLRRMREEAAEGLTLSAFKKLLREQFSMLLLDERRAVEAIPAMLGKDPDLAPATGNHAMIVWSGSTPESPWPRSNSSRRARLQRARRTAPAGRPMWPEAQARELPGSARHEVKEESNVWFCAPWI